MPLQRAKHKRHLQAWIDEKVYAAFQREQRVSGATPAQLLERILSKQLKCKPSGKVAARTGMPGEGKRLTVAAK